MHVLDDPSVSARVRSFLAAYGRRAYQSMSAERVKSLACTFGGEVNESPAPAEVVAAMVAFEERYGGLETRLPDRNPTEYGLDGEARAQWTPYGWAFTAILDGPQTWPVDVLIDGRTAMAMPRAPYRIINSSVEQRLESDALKAAVRSWRHRALTATAERLAIPAVANKLLPPRVAEATGPADLWWSDDQIAVHLRLFNWWRGRSEHAPDRDTWTVRCFTRDPTTLDEAIAAVRAGFSGLATPEETWCSLCGRFVPPGQSCPPGER
ncbi:hypothetical protein FB559_3459 [Actinoallomurus bryophytorum]|uniref:Uncharacterized protein n=1 Tax=Actinoallomurus bryophytorum TaxID=1490222 RepID=A0A543CL78_9ACTN|nr:hypothetical protein [Actinoallomurus bryophytorum]TQL97851.1 hypothetical protein FB559_3459 [Actinoallomurus bryophytorum]